MAELRRTHAQRKYAQGTCGPPTSSCLPCTPARLGAGPGVGSRPTPASARERTPEKMGLNVHELIDTISLRGLRKLDLFPQIKLERVENDSEKKEKIKPAKIKMEKIRIPIIKLSQISNSHSPKRTEFAKQKKTTVSRLPTLQVPTPVPRSACKLEGSKATEKPVTRSKSSSLTGKSLRSRNIGISSKTTVTQVKMVTLKSPTLKPSDPLLEKKRMLRKRIIVKKLSLRPALKLKTRSTDLVARPERSPPARKPPTIRTPNISPRITRKRVLKPTITKAKRPRRNVRGSPSSPEYSSDDETPLKYIPKEKKAIVKNTASISEPSDSKIDLPPIPVTEIVIPMAKTSDENIPDENKPNNFVEVKNEQKHSNEVNSAQKPVEVHLNDENVPDRIQNNPSVQEAIESSPKSETLNSNKAIIREELTNQIYDFKEEPPITSFTTHKKKMEITTQVSSDNYIIYGSDNRLRCKLNKDKILGNTLSTSLPSTSAGDSKSNGTIMTGIVNGNLPMAVPDLDLSIDEYSDPSVPGSDSGLEGMADPGLMQNRIHDNHRQNRTACSYEAPVFRPSAADFKDPLEYIQRITPIASKWGICKIITPATTADITPHLPEEVKFNCSNEYLHRMYMRWGPATRELCAIKHNLESNEIKFNRPPLIDGVEVNLPAFYTAVQNHGGFKEILEKVKWEDIAEELKINKKDGRKVASQLYKIYCRYLLTYDTMSHADRQSLLERVDREWGRRFKRMVARAARPTHRQRRPLRSSTSSDTDEEEQPGGLDECVTRGRSMSMAYFQNLAGVIRQMYLPGQPAPPPEEAEREFWKHVLLRAQHVCVYAAAVDSGEAGLGFPRPAPGQPPWNLKVLSDSAGSVLRSLGPVMGLTVPTVHFGMLFSTTCWNRDPHGLPWIEYHHEGAPKIWYSIPDKQSNNFKQAVGKLAPSFCLNKTIWLPSDVLMLPPSLLTENGVSLARTVQHPGELVVVFPKAYTSSVCTGYSVSESVYFGPEDWLTTVQQDFQEAQDSCEPTMFPLEQLLLAIARDPRSTKPVLLQAYSTLKMLVDDECRHRHVLQGFKVKVVHKPIAPGIRGRPRAVQEECDVCRSSLFLSKVNGVLESHVCSKHAVAIIEKSKKKINLEVVELICRQTDKELSQALDDMEGRIFG